MCVLRLNGCAAGTMSQRELIAEAFAGDDVAAEFEAEKAAEVEAELPGFEAPSLLPGWGTWASQQKEPKWMRDARAKAERYGPQCLLYSNIPLSAYLVVLFVLSCPMFPPSNSTSLFAANAEF